MLFQFIEILEIEFVKIGILILKKKKRKERNLDKIRGE